MSHNRQATDLDRSRQRKSNRGNTRRGSLLAEVAVASALLAAAVVAFGKLSVSATQFRRQGEQMLTTQLAADNAIERLRGLPREQIEAFSTEEFSETNASCGCTIGVEATSAVIGKTRCVRVTVQAQHPSGARTLRTRWWPVENQQPDPQQSDTTEEEDTEPGDSVRASETTEPSALAAGFALTTFAVEQKWAHE